ncbi:MAG TPA: hypothetical protein PKE47_03365 [Verrucomicrobiota bacterium]|nr:hypothetical protein [Verrucomicrobiota bacterium]
MPATPYPLHLPEELQTEIRRASEETGLSLAEAMRQSMRLGLPALRARLRRRTARVANVQPWPAGALARAYRRDRTWEAVEQAAAAAQPPPRWAD